ncbi:MULTISPECIES: tellurium resistance protein [unclassified Acinetobacter]|uniref:tellurium resistance protein n=1 Tax=unclassified Acinetobacter TaxID=196816 RepID=UPI002934DB9F|nr:MULTISPECIES: tellurium resistance protein [unclassified Acinetobacter]WOE31688.1 tellurium resistance protein [Acinetobacter sp. SAAs470]WOE37153.1 tellurium resistance protein [Acinetobacter sp. SAAs474]
MSQMTILTPIQEIAVDDSQLLTIKRDDLVPLLAQHSQLNHYADHVVQAQSLLLDGIDSQLIQQFSQTIVQLISALSISKRDVKQKKFNRVQKWLGLDIEYGANQIAYYQKLDDLLRRASEMSQQLQYEIHQSQAKLANIDLYRQEMAHYIIAAEQFLDEYPSFMKHVHPLDHFTERLAKKILNLRTLQAHNDIAITQIQLSQQTALTLLDRFQEAENVLIPAWQYYVKQRNQDQSHADFTQLDRSRSHLMKMLKTALDKITPQ